MYEGYSDFNLNNGKTVKAEEKTGVSGQGNNNPRSTFGNHAIVKYSGNYFDPSYGSAIANDANSWETPALDGFGSILQYKNVHANKFINWVGHLNDSTPQSNIQP